VPVTYVMEFENLDEQQYRAVLQRLGVAEQAGEGILHHSAGPTQDGRWMVVDVWETEAASEAPSFYDQILPNVMAEMGLPAPRRIDAFDAREVRNVRAT